MTWHLEKCMRTAKIKKKKKHWVQVPMTEINVYVIHGYLYTCIHVGDWENGLLSFVLGECSRRAALG
jgi:hypothetical protein